MRTALAGYTFLSDYTQFIQKVVVTEENKMDRCIKPGMRHLQKQKSSKGNISWTFSTAY